MLTNFGGWDMDITTYTMILTAKLSAMGFCYKDGGEKEDTLLKEQKDLKIVKLPNVIELLGYVFFSPGCICGPFFEYADYKRYIEMTDQYKNIPLTIIPCLTRLFYGKCKFNPILRDNNLDIISMPWSDHLCWTVLLAPTLQHLGVCRDAFY
jgi:hypothetical protein